MQLKVKLLKIGMNGAGSNAGFVIFGMVPMNPRDSVDVSSPSLLHRSGMML